MLKLPQNHALTLTAVMQTHANTYSHRNTNTTSTLRLTHTNTDTQHHPLGCFLWTGGEDTIKSEVILWLEGGVEPGIGRPAEGPSRCVTRRALVVGLRHTGATEFFFFFKDEIIWQWVGAVVTTSESWKKFPGIFLHMALFFTFFIEFFFPGKFYFLALLKSLLGLPSSPHG